MLRTVEEIEDEILKVLITYEDELVNTEERMDRIIEEGKKKLDEYEGELNKYYEGQEVGTYEEEYISLYRQGKENILESVKQLLEKEATTMSAKIVIPADSEAVEDDGKTAQ